MVTGYTHVQYMILGRDTESDKDTGAPGGAQVRGEPQQHCSAPWLHMQIVPYRKGNMMRRVMKKTAANRMKI